jgi:hypothetical protein
MRAILLASATAALFTPRPAQHALFHLMPACIEAHDMERILCQIQSNGRNLHLGLLSLRFDGWVSTPIVALLTPGRKREETISSTAC